MKKYITLGEVCEKGSSTLMQKDLSLGNGPYKIYGASGLLGTVDFYKQEKEYIGIVKDGAGVGRAMLLPEKSSCIGTMQYLIPRENINVRFLFYAIESMNLAKYNTGATIPHIYFKDYKKEVLPLFDIQEQLKIAHQLDKIRSLISYRQSQLKYFDHLVKSQFIEMFGNPIFNTKSLPVISLSRMTSLKSGKNVTAKDLHEYSKNTPYPCYGGNGVRGYVDKFSHEGQFCLIGRQGALCGNVQFAEGRFYATEHAVVVTQTEKSNVNWLFYCLKYLELNRLQTGAAQPGLNIDILNQVQVPRPSEKEQNRFAAFVEETDKSKIPFEMEVAA